MKKSLLMAALAAAVVGGALGCGGGRSGVKPAPPSVSTFTDTRDGKVYKIVQIGRQVWFAENLNYDAEGSVCYENSADSCAKYGRLYDWNTAMKACPVGTRLPTDKEWTALTDAVGGEKTAGTMLKSSTGWNSYDRILLPVSRDEYGFSALPGGYGYGDDPFKYAGKFGCWWSATEFDAISVDYYGRHARMRGIYYLSENVDRYQYGKANQFSVRCVADKEAKK